MTTSKFDSNLCGAAASRFSTATCPVVARASLSNRHVPSGRTGLPLQPPRAQWSHEGAWQTGTHLMTRAH
eukprot:357591-Chlamydomonas_euryale.AAC.4